MVQTDTVAEGDRALSHAPAQIGDPLAHEVTALCADIALACHTADRHMRGCSLASGLVGPALYLAAWSRRLGGPSDLQAAARLTDIAYARMADARPGLDWIGGLTGTTWALRRLTCAIEGGDAVDPDFSRVVDDALLDSLADTCSQGPYDLIGGLVGTGLYALDHPVPAIRSALVDRVLHHLAALAKETDGGLAWFTPPRLLNDAQRAMYPAGHYNLGLAHGVPGVVGFLARCVQADCHRARAADLLVPAVTWLLSHARGSWGSNNADSAGPSFALVAGDKQPARLAWCYGDLGVCVALVRAADALNRGDWLAVARRVADGSAGRRGADTRVSDAGLCHGSAGAALLFHRLSQRLGGGLYADARRHWLGRTLALRSPDVGNCAGIFSVEWNAGAHRAVPTLGYLAGAAGVGLALLDCLAGVDAGWDMPLLTDL